MDKAKEAIVQKLKASGCRITKQRLMLLDIILEENCSCCKEIYYRASRIDPSIGTCDPDCDLQNAFTVELDDDTIKHLSAKNWNAVIQAGLKACGYVEDQKVRNITVQS